MFFLGCGALAGSLVATLVPQGLRDLCTHEVQRKTFVLSRPSDELVEVTPARWFFLPMLFGDFDLQMDIELGEGVELDLLLRQVEPRMINDETLPFAGRFSVLRLSTEGDGVAWRTREQALLGPFGDGVGLAAGYPATVWVEGRGRRLRANVAGKWQPWFEADDVYGMFTMIARGGKSVIHRLEITPRPIAKMWLWSAWTWSGLGVLAAAIAAAAAFMLARTVTLVSGGVVWVALNWLILRDVATELCFPDPGAMLGLLVGTLCVSGLFLVRSLRNVAYWPVAIAGLLLVYTSSASGLRDNHAINEVFGPKAGAQLAEAHGSRVRGPVGILDLGVEGSCVFLLGGQMLYNQGQPSDHLGVLLARELRATLRKPVKVPALPTVDGHSAQQWRMFERFYQGYRPEVVILGIGQLEGVEDEWTGVPRSSAASLTETLQAAKKNCDEQGRHLVLYAEHFVPRSFMLVMQRLEASGVPLVVAREGEPAASVAKRLAAACQPLMK